MGEVKNQLRESLGIKGIETFFDDAVGPQINLIFSRRMSDNELRIKQAALKNDMKDRLKQEYPQLEFEDNINHINGTIQIFSYPYMVGFTITPIHDKSGIIVGSLGGTDYKKIREFLLKYGKILGEEAS